ncbi:putative 50S ribosomal protein L7/L12 [Corchorus olitorius]|uniref:50S ribosomal protein L7/L12 n=1 Tax=Corchorus olitorius TaxID=93759 RepID=A0A1R3H9Z8_9ROSI|nr:putative 50S ribosomal protein L7/L12 [Corchorus olitorius]
MEWVGLVKAIRSGCPSVCEITGSLQFRTFQHDFVPRDPIAKPKKYKYPQVFYDPYGPRPPPSDAIVQLAERVAALQPEERKQIGHVLAERLRHLKLLRAETEGMDLGSQGRGGAGAIKVEEKK